MRWKTLDQMELAGKKVLTRVDLNVPIIADKISDNTRIKKIIPTLTHIIKNNIRATGRAIATTAST